MKVERIIFLLLINLSFLFNTQAQNISNEGTDFWSVFPTHDPSFYLGNPKLANITIYVSSKSNSEVTVTCGAWSETKEITANVVQTFQVPRSDAYIDLSDINNIKVQKGIHVQVSPGRPKVAVYAHIYAGARSAASLVLPEEALGQQYYSMNFTQNGNIDDGAGRNYLAIVATEPNTKVIIHTREGDRPVSFTNAGEVYEYMPPDQRDLTGTIVEIDPSSPDNCTKRFAVFSGNTSVSIGCGDPAIDARDPLYQQLYPITSWGKNYAVAPFKDRKYLFRVLAQDDDTKVSFNGVTITLDKGQYYDSPTPLKEALFITANKKISVAQYSLSQSCSSATSSVMLGDPDMVLLNPVEFNVKAITLFSSTKERILERYINVSMKTSATSTFKINGLPPENGTWSAIPSNPEYSFIQIRINDVNSTLIANEGFNAIAYGFGVNESYSYSAGTNLAADNYLLIHNKVTNTESENACIGQESYFKIVLPYKALKIIWRLEGYDPVDGLLEPLEIPTPNGPTYAYLYDKGFTFNELGKLKMLVTAIMPNDNNCLGGEIEYDFDFEINGLPKPDFSFPKACAEDLVVFKNISVNDDGTSDGLTYYWDFNDPAGNSASTGRDAEHKFSAPGNYMITLTATNRNNCSVSTSKEIVVNSSIAKPSFEVLNGNNLCGDEKVIVKNTSTSIVGKIIKLEWYKNNESEPFITDNDPEINETYEVPYTPFTSGTVQLNIILKAYTGVKCYNVETKNIIIYSKPSLVFDAIPDVCIDKGKVNITQGHEALGIGGTFKYAGPAGSITKEGVFDPEVAGVGIHQITYSFTTSNGCTSSINRSVVVAQGPQLRLERDIYIFEGGQKQPDIWADGINLTYKWSPSVNLSRDDILNPIITPDEDREYTLTITSSEGCSASQIVLVHVLMKVQPPNAFSPNGDQINDTWVIPYIESYPDVTVDIFTRYGEHIFFSKGYSVPFDGKFKDQSLPVGTYYYIIDPKKGRKRVTGALTILK